MLIFKIFKAGQFTEAEITKFGNENIILKDKYLENGDIYIYYKPASMLGLTAIEKIEQLDNAIGMAQKEIFSADLDKRESEAKLADVQERISKSNPNEKEWEPLQAERKFHENQITQSEKTIAGRTAQITDFSLKHQDLLVELEAENAELDKK